MTLHPAQFAGRFYTSEPVPLNRHVRLLVQGGKVGRSLTKSRPTAIIAPHAGYRFSGEVAGQAYAAAITEAYEHDYKRIVVISPSHSHRFAGIALPGWRGASVPNGVIGVDKLCRNDLIDRGLAHIDHAAHDAEHGVETQFPFIARYLRSAPVIPLVIGRTKVADVARVIDHLAGDPDVATLFILSTDLSHFHDTTKAAQLDAATAQMIETGDMRGLDGQHACGWMPVAGFFASELGKRCQAIRLAMDTSFRVTQDASSVVGYGAWAVYPNSIEVFNDKRRAELLRVARQALTLRLKNKRDPKINLGSFGAPLQTTLASFVTLQRQGHLRGCIGSLSPHQPLVQDVITNSIKAGTSDPRFEPLNSPKQLEELKLKIAILSRPAPMAVSNRTDLENQIIPGKSGLIVTDQGKRGTFLPMVWESLKDPSDFVDGVMQKAGLPKDHWSPTLRVAHYTTESFAETEVGAAAK